MAEENEDYKKYQEILEDLKNTTNEAGGILNLLKVLLKNANLHKDIFTELSKEITQSLSEIKEAKSFLKNLIKRQDEVDEFIKNTSLQQENLKNLIKEIEEINKNVKWKMESINSLKEYAEEKKKLITEYKNDAQKSVDTIQKLRNKSAELIWKIENDQKDSERIVKFLNEQKKEVIEMHDEIKTEYSNLFEQKDDEGNNKIQRLNRNINNISSFNTKLDSEIKPNLDARQSSLLNLEKDFELQKKQIASLLSDATSGALDQSYLESMYEYSDKKEKPYNKSLIYQNWFNKADLVKDIIGFLENIILFIYNILIRKLGTLFNYLVFIAPLIWIVASFYFPEYITAIIKDVTKSSSIISVKEIIVIKALIAFPLLWISWFGQQNISQRKRLFEEYNHKSRVVRMYIMFTSNSAIYPLEQKVELERVLMEAIKMNPAEHLGKGETMIDKLIDKFHSMGLYKKLKEEIVDSITDKIVDEVKEKRKK